MKIAKKSSRLFFKLLESQFKNVLVNGSHVVAVKNILEFSSWKKNKIYPIIDSIF